MSKRGRIIGVRHRFPASPMTGVERPVQVFIIEPVKGGPDRKQSFRLVDDEAVQRFIERVPRICDAIVLSGSNKANRLAYALAHHAKAVQATVLRIERDVLMDHLNGTLDDMSQVLARTYQFMPQLFTAVSDAEVAAYRAKHKLDQKEFDF